MSDEKNNPTVALFGLPISNVTMEEAVTRIAQNIESGTLHQIATANLDFARNSRSNRFLHRVICSCSMVLPDGAPMLWASRLMGQPLKERVTGVDLVPELAKLSAERGYGIYLLGSDDTSAAKAIEIMKQRYPGVNFVGRYSPPVKPLAEMNSDEILNRIAAVNPDILLVAMGNPKQELWIAQNRDRMHVPVAIGIGGSLDMISGQVRRAPKFIQKLQLEWLFRMAQEPRRLMPRYARDLKALLWHLPIEVMMNKFQPNHEQLWPLMVEVIGDARILEVSEVLGGADCVSIIAEAKSAVKNHQMLIINMTLTIQVQADGIGCLLEVRRIMQAANQTIWLADVSQPIQRRLQASSLLEVFRIAASPAEAIRRSIVDAQHPERRTRARVVSGAPRPGVETQPPNTANLQ